MEIKYIIIWIIVLVIAGFIVNALVNPNNNFLSLKGINKLDLKEYNQNPQDYLGKEVKVYAEFISRACHYASCDVFVDKEGYEIIVLSSRNFQFNKWYDLEGTIVYEENYLGDKEYCLKE